MLAFALPFGAVSSCDGEEVRSTGVELTTFSVPPDESGSGELDANVEERAGLLALIAAVAAISGIALTALGRRGAGLCAAAGLLAMQLVAYAIATTSDSADLFVGYWLALGAFAVAAVTQLVRELSTRVSEQRSIWPPLVLAVGVVLPPLGFAAAFLLWLVTVFARGLRGLHTERYV